MLTFKPFDVILVDGTSRISCSLAMRKEWFSLTGWENGAAEVLITRYAPETVLVLALRQT